MGGTKVTGPFSSSPCELSLIGLMRKRVHRLACRSLYNFCAVTATVSRMLGFTVSPVT